MGKWLNIAVRLVSGEEGKKVMGRRTGDNKLISKTSKRGIKGLYYP